MQKQEEQQSKQEFYDELSREMEQQARDKLRERLPELLNNKVDAANWCRNIANDHHISEGVSSAFLKEELGIDVELLPEPEIFITIECHDCKNDPTGICQECRSLESDLPRI